jgi:hypothetical protein
MPMDSRRHRRAVVMGGWPVAASVQRCAELLHVDQVDVEAAAATLEPYTAADGTPKWSVRRLAALLRVAPPRYRPFKGSIRAGG